ncbi:MAG: hypothetical protein KDD81_05780 [Rhodobacteraceae bacterium]|nr:hypothetical protein [Paracoccaceae bacterium]MCC0045422.1 hypothetical protein [Defluviimonas sp.]MCB2120387.1 hypothetical protein [Paracoccaceae bacterium]MCB2122156.1 hypothetical protein [Paracoccaceae bacterium]MCB2139830.1 hypothetical protein [Paracoccaceae bacterium]
MNQTPKAPANPYAVLAATIVLPGTGHVLNRQPFRGLIFLFFMLLLGGFTLKTAAPDVSLVGKFAGGIFVYALSILDAYKTARVRAEVWRHRHGQAQA